MNSPEVDQALELKALQAENARLIALLESHGIEWRLPKQPIAVAAQEPEPSRLSTTEKVALFRRLFRGRTDVYPIRWEGKTSGKSGYSPACANEWRAGVCEKARVKCGDCSNRLLMPLSDAVIFDHLAGEHTVGVYPLLEDDTCYFLAVDFDEADWCDDARAFMQSCHELGVPAALEISRSGNGAHAWVFFANWGDAIFMVRLPREAIDQNTLKAFCTSPYLEFEKLPEHWLLTWSLGETENDDRFGCVEKGSGLMPRLAPLREELLRGDLRSLYIGWLHAVTAEETDPDDLEPLALHGLNTLTAAQQALAEFLEVDIDLLAGVGSGSQKNQPDAADDAALDAWLAKLASDFPQAWEAAHDHANKGHARDYDAACRQLVDLCDAYSQHVTLAAFQKELQKFMAEHTRRRALVQRLVKAGLW